MPAPAGPVISVGARQAAFAEGKGHGTALAKPSLVTEAKRALTAAHTLGNETFPPCGPHS